LAISVKGRTNVLPSQLGSVSVQLQCMFVPHKAGTVDEAQTGLVPSPESAAQRCPAAQSAVVAHPFRQVGLASDTALTPTQTSSEAQGGQAPEPHSPALSDVFPPPPQPTSSAAQITTHLIVERLSARPSYGAGAVTRKG
jgi:hypothetical protein